MTNLIIIFLLIGLNLFEKEIKIIGVGDMMIGTTYPSEKYLPPNNGKDVFNDVSQIIRDADLSFGNLEGTILSGDGDVKKCSNPEKCYAFKSPDNFVYNYKEAGFDLLSLANNHINDFGEVGRLNTQNILQKNEIFFSGTIEKPFSIFIKNNIKYGFAAFSPNKGTIQINNYDRAKEIVNHLDSICDIVIISFHGGAEGLKYNRVTKKREYFLGEDRGNIYEFSRFMIDNGADIVFGHGPHVLRAVDLYKDRFIAYSLGNFATYKRFNLSGGRGLSPLIQVTVNSEGEFIRGKIISARQVGLGIPKLDNSNEAAKEIKRLTELDFPESELIIDNIGNITLQ